ncbi:MAG TPA: MFS transporter [Streptosporangiaceae bacterium]
MASDQAVTAQAPAALGRDSVLANRDFVRLWTGETISLIGTQVTQFTMPLVAIITLRATVFEVGVLNALRFVPVILLSLLAGVWLDRRRRRPILIACALGNAVLIGLIPLASVTGLLTIGLLYAVVPVAGALSMTFDVGALSYVPFLVERRHLLAANSKLQASTSVAGVAGPGLAGLLVGLITAPVTLSVDAVSYIFSALGLISIASVEPPPETGQEKVPVRRSIAEGLRAVYGNRLLRALLTQGTALNLFFGSYIVVFVVYAVRVLGLTPGKLGIVLGASAAGGVVGALSATRVRQVLRFDRTMAVTTIGVSTALLLLLVPGDASLRSMGILIAAQFVYGCSIAMSNVNAITLRQAVTPQHVLARMNATYRMLLYGSAPVGAIAGGLLGSAYGLRSALVISLLTMISPALWLIFSPVYRLREIPAGPESANGMDGTDG